MWRSAFANYSDANAAQDIPRGTHETEACSQTQSDPSKQVDSLAAVAVGANQREGEPSKHAASAPPNHDARRPPPPREAPQALATLRRYDQGLLSEKQVARSMDRLFARGRDDDLRDAFRYFLPAELAV